MSDKDEKEQHKHWKEEVAFEVWKHHASIGGADKDRMIQIATWLLAFSAAIIGFTFKETVQSYTVTQPLTAIVLSFLGLLITAVSAFTTLLYGGYANWNWAKADQIASDYKWDRLNPGDFPFKVPEKPFLIAFALRKSVAQVPNKKLAPIFRIFIWISLITFLVHLGILIWAIVCISRNQNSDVAALFIV